MDPLVAAIGFAVVLVAGIGIGWWLGSKPAADARAERDAAQAALKDLQERFNAAIRDLAGASERGRQADDLAVRLEAMRTETASLSGQLAAASERARQADELAARLDTLRAEHAAAARELATMKADAANHDKQVRQLVEAREQLAQQFGEVGNKLLGEAQEAFLRRANERFAQSEEKNEEKIRTLLAPVGERLKTYEEQVQKIEATRSEAYGDLKGLMDQMRTGQQQVRDETARLVNSLRNAPKARGRWGEQQLKNVLESCGLSQHTDFLMEVSVETEDGRLRPDAVIRIPGGRTLIVDAKVSLNDYQDAFEAEDDLVKSTAMARHFQSMKNHVNALGGKAYQTQFGDAPDYVIMFVPGEHFLSAAMEHDSSPFMPRHPSVYGNLLKERIAKGNVTCWLVNTGWTGGKYGVGSRMPIKATRALLNAALDGSLNNTQFETDPNFGFEVPVSVPGVDSAILNPRGTWADKADYDATAQRLVGQFIDNFAQFEDHVDDAVRAAAPQRQAVTA
jgi:DNA recombination protein RmuC